MIYSRVHSPTPSINHYSMSVMRSFVKIFNKTAQKSEFMPFPKALVLNEQFQSDFQFPEIIQTNEIYFCCSDNMLIVDSLTFFRCNKHFLMERDFGSELFGKSKQSKNGMKLFFFSCYFFNMKSFQYLFTKIHFMHSIFSPTFFCQNVM